MPSGIRICKVCGVEYPYCQTVTNDKFRWQDVACCQEHAIEYFQLIESIRSGEQAPEKKNEEIEIEPAHSEPKEELDVDIVASEEKVPIIKKASSFRRR